MTTKERAIELTKLNLHAIFGERDVRERMVVISSLWASTPHFVDQMGVFKSHQAISDMVDTILGMGGPEDTFAELSAVECLQKDEEADLWVTRVKWGVGPTGGELKLTGWDVVTIEGGKIKACYTFLDSK